jgi:plasmid stability protein
MATITIRNLPQDIVVNLKAQAAGNGRSMEQEVREILTFRLAPKNKVLDEIQTAWATFSPPSEQDVLEWIDSGRQGRK